MEFLFESITNHWPIWLVSFVLVVAAIIDGICLKVPNWITFPMIATGWAYSLVAGSWEGLAWSITGTVVGLVLLLMVYCIGGMGAGDVKLLAGIGAWVHLEHTFWIFMVTTIVGGIMALAMIAISGRWRKHLGQMKMLSEEIVVLKDPERLFERAAKRKPTMLLLPYGIPMTIAALGYFFYQGLYW
jgi:prepilin peptidase CpaA